MMYDFLMEGTKALEAEILHNKIRIQAVQKIESEIIAVVDCNSIDDYKRLPDAISFEGKVMGKTGWSSDYGYAYFKTGSLLAKKL